MSVYVWLFFIAFIFFLLTYLQIKVHSVPCTPLGPKDKAHNSKTKTSRETSIRQITKNEEIHSQQGKRYLKSCYIRSALLCLILINSNTAEEIKSRAIVLLLCKRLVPPYQIYPKSFIKYVLKHWCSGTNQLHRSKHGRTHKTNFRKFDYVRTIFTV